MTTGTPKRPRLSEEAVVVVALDDDDPLALGDQALHHGDADRAQPDHDDVVDHARDLAAAE